MRNSGIYFSRRSGSEGGGCTGGPAAGALSPWEGRGDGGFTLLEILVVVALLGIITMIAVPTVSHSQGSWQLEKTARLMVADFRLAQQTAVASGKTCRIEFFRYIEAYRVRTPGSQKLVRLPEGIFIAYNNFPGYDGGNFQLLSFNRNGSPNRAGTISLGNAKGERIYIIVNLASGRMRISEEPPAGW